MSMSHPTNQTSKPKLSQIARLAGVSVTTASRALRGKGRINDETVLRVRTVAQMLGYPTAPTSISEHRAKLIVTVTNPTSQLSGSDGLEQTHTFWFRFYFGLVAKLTSKGTGVVWTTTDSQNMMIPIPVSAILLASLDIPRPPIIDLGYDVPIIVSGVPDPSDDPRIKAYVGYDNEQAAWDACEHLAESGAKKLAVVARPVVGTPALQWIAGYEKWCADHNHELTVIRDEVDHDELDRKVRDALDSGVDGLFIAMPSPIATIKTILDSGKAIPQDVQVVTWEEIAEHPSEMPEYTRIAPKALDAAQILADTIDKVIDGEPRQQVFFDYELIQGKSTLPN